MKITLECWYILLETGIKQNPYNPIPRQAWWIFGRYKHLYRRSPNNLDLTWYIFLHLTVFLPLLCVLLTSMINLFISLPQLVVRLSVLSAMQALEQRGVGWAVHAPPILQGPFPSAQSVCGQAFPRNVPGSCSLVSFLLAHVLWTLAGCLHNQEHISWLACGPGICLWAAILDGGEMVLRAVGLCFTCSAGSPRGLTPCPV